MATKAQLEEQLAIKDRELKEMKENVIKALKHIKQDTCSEFDEHYDTFKEITGISIPGQLVSIIVEIPGTLDKEDIEIWSGTLDEEFKPREIKVIG